MDKNNRNRKKKEESEDILGMIRKRQEQWNTAKATEHSRTKLRNFLDNLNQDDDEPDYTDSPIYKLGYEDGYDEAEAIYSNKLNIMRNSLKSLLIDL